MNIFKLWRHLNGHSDYKKSHSSFVFVTYGEKNLVYFWKVAFWHLMSRNHSSVLLLKNNNKFCINFLGVTQFHRIFLETRLEWGDYKNCLKWSDWSSNKGFSKGDFEQIDWKISNPNLKDHGICERPYAYQVLPCFQYSSVNLLGTAISSEKCHSSLKALHRP